MNPFPAADRLQFLVGLEVEQICLDPWTIQLRLSGDGRITTDGELQHTDARGDMHIYNAGEERDMGPVYLRELVQERIAGFSVEPLRLTLSFSNGAALSILTEGGPYEWGQIYPPGQPNSPVVF